MNLKCLVGSHAWDGCKCSACGKTRDEGHDWAGCKCSICGDIRDEGHDWSQDCERCARCGSGREGAHEWDGFVCGTCGGANQPAIAALIRDLVEHCTGASDVRLQAQRTLTEAGEIGIPALIEAIRVYSAVDHAKCGPMAVLARLGTPAVEPLIRALNDNNDSFRQNAVVVLGRIGDTRATAPLIRALWSSGDSHENAAEALADMDELDALARVLEEGDDKRAARVVSALGLSGDPRAVDLIIRRLGRASETQLLLNTGIVLATLGDARAVEPLMRARRSNGYLTDLVVQCLAEAHSVEAVKPLIEVLEEVLPSGIRGAYTERGHNWKYCGVVAAEELGRIGDERAVGPLIKALGCWGPEVKSAAARALGRLRNESAIEPLVELADDENGEVRAAAGWALAACGDARGVERLLEDLSDDRYVCEAAVSLARLGDPRGEAALCHGETEQPSYAWLKAVVEVARLGTKPSVDLLLRVFPAVLKRLSHHDSAPAIEIVGEAGDGRALEALIGVRGLPGALRAIGRIGDERGMDALIRGLTYDLDRRLEATEALGQIGTAGAVDALIWALDDLSPLVRAAAARSLGQLGDSRALGPLIGILGAKPRRVRLAAIGALARLGDPAAIEPLTKLAEADQSLSQPIAEAIAELQAVLSATIGGGASSGVTPVIKMTGGECFYCLTPLISVEAARPLYDECVSWFTDGRSNNQGPLAVEFAELSSVSGAIGGFAGPAIAISGHWDRDAGLFLPPETDAAVGVEIYSDYQTTTRRAEYLQRRSKLMASARL